MKNQSFSVSSPVTFTSVENIPQLKALAAFTVDSSSVFRDDVDHSPITIGKDVSYMPWGADNLMPYRIMNLVESDETLATCQSFNAEVCYAAGLRYSPSEGVSSQTAAEVEEFYEENDLPSYFLGVCQDFKYYGFCVSVIILNKKGDRITNIIRKEACYCRFAQQDKSGRIPYVLYANWRLPVGGVDKVEKIDLLDPLNPFACLQECVKKSSKRKFALVSRIPTPDSTYYPIPSYASIFKSKWYNIKQLIATAKEANLKNSAPIKYHIEISKSFWDGIFKTERITDPKKMQERVVKEKEKIVEFLTGAENSGKAWFSTFYITPDGRECHDVVINKVDSGKAGGDYEVDIQEAVNIICFSMRVHSNLVGSVPGKAQSNNSGSDKRELYTIAQSLQKPYHDILFRPHRLIIRFNGWKGFRPECPVIQLTTLDSHKDMTVSTTE